MRSHSWITSRMLANVGHVPNTTLRRSEGPRKTTIRNYDLLLNTVIGDILTVVKTCFWFACEEASKFFDRNKSSKLIDSYCNWL